MGRGSAVAAVVLLRWPSVDVDVDHFFESAFINEKPYVNKLTLPSILTCRTIVHSR